MTTFDGNTPSEYAVDFSYSLDSSSFDWATEYGTALRLLNSGMSTQLNRLIPVARQRAGLSLDASFAENRLNLVYEMRGKGAAAQESAKKLALWQAQSNVQKILQTQKQGDQTRWIPASIDFEAHKTAIQDRKRGQSETDSTYRLGWDTSEKALDRVYLTDTQDSQEIWTTALSADSRATREYIEDVNAQALADQQTATESASSGLMLYQLRADWVLEFPYHILGMRKDYLSGGVPVAHASQIDQDSTHLSSMPLAWDRGELATLNWAGVGVGGLNIQWDYLIEPIPFVSSSGSCSLPYIDSSSWSGCNQYLEGGFLDNMEMGKAYNSGDYL